MSEKIRCLHTIMGQNGSNRPGTEVLLSDLGITVEQARPLILSGAAEWVQPLASLAGVQEQDGSITELESMKRDELLALAKDMGIPSAAGMNKQQLIDAIRAEPVVPGDDAGEQGAAWQQDGEA